MNTEVINKVIQFRDERDWKQFHNLKDLSLALSIEASELLEVFLWKDPKEVEIEKIKEELADVILYAILLSHEAGISLEEIVLEKLDTNSKKYPVEKAKGNSQKYTEL